MSWWNAISTCWPPGQGGCVVWWDAWAAVGTISAAIAAVWLGTKPIIARRRHAIAVTRIAHIRLEIQLLHLGASAVVAKAATSVSDHNVAKVNAEQIDSKPLADLIPYFDVMPKDLSVAIGKCVAEIEILRSMLARVQFRTPGGILIPSNLAAILNRGVSALWDVRRQLQSYLGEPAQELQGAIDLMAQNLKTLGKLSELDPGQTEEELRTTLIGRIP